MVRSAGIVWNGGGYFGDNPRRGRNPATPKKAAGTNRAGEVTRSRPYEARQVTKFVATHNPFTA